MACWLEDTGPSRTRKGLKSGGLRLRHVGAHNESYRVLGGLEAACSEWGILARERIGKGPPGKPESRDRAPPRPGVQALESQGHRLAGVCHESIRGHVGKMFEVSYLGTRKN